MGKTNAGLKCATSRDGMRCLRAANMSFLIALLALSAHAQVDQIHALRVAKIEERVPELGNQTRITMDVEFSYSGKPYRAAVLDAWTLKDGKYFPGVRGGGPVIEAGRHKDVVYLFFDPKTSPGTHETQELAFGFSEARDGAERNTTRPFKVVKFQRVWGGAPQSTLNPSSAQAPRQWRLPPVCQNPTLLAFMSSASFWLCSTAAWA